MIRYIRAAIQAAMMMLRGEQPSSALAQRYPLLHTWQTESLAALAAVEAAIAAAAFDTAAHTVTVDGRTVSAKTILGGVRYHLTIEYPHLAQDSIDHALVVVYSSNMNDVYAVNKLLESALPDSVKTATQQLSGQLANIPSSQEVQGATPNDG